MSDNLKKLFLSLFFFFLFILLSAKGASAATLFGAEDIISTSRPSALSTLSLGATAPAAQVFFTDNKTRFIASDSAMLIGGPGANETMTVASMSAIAGSTAAVYFTRATAGNHNIGTTVMTPVTAQHIISFRTVNAVPSSGSIQAIFPVGNAVFQSYPSPNGFSFNSLASGNLSATFSPVGPTCSTWTITPGSGLVQCNIGTGMTGPTTVTINIGLSNTNPIVINPSKTAAAGTADTWTVQLKTRDASGVDIDSSKIKIGTIDSVEVFATVEPYLTFVINGLANAAAINTGNTSGCTNTEVINTGFASTATEVNLGVLGAGVVNIGAQLLSVTTNGVGGYALTATSSGHLNDAAVGYFLRDAQGTPTNNELPVPAAVVAGTTAFGIHACGQDVNTGTWGIAACTTAGGTCLYANPAATYYYTLASDGTGPIGSGSGDGYGDGLVSTEYAATISNIVPAGVYKTVLTYVATATF